MKIKIHSTDLNRMMKTITQCIDNRDISGKANILVESTGRELKIRSTNGTVYAELSTLLISDETDSFCVDGRMFAKVISGCNGIIDIESDNQVVIKGTGKTRLPIVSANIPTCEPLEGSTVSVSCEQFQKCYNAVNYAVSADQSRLVLTGILVDVENGNMKMVSVDGFQLAVESIPCEGDSVKAVVPGNFMKLVAQSIQAGGEMKITVNKSRIQVKTDDMLLSSGLLTGDFIDYSKIIPDTFSTETFVNSEKVRNALKSGSIVNDKNNIVKMCIENDRLIVSSSGEKAEFEAEIDCETNGNGLTIGFNQRFLINAMNAVGTEQAIIQMNSNVTPIVVHGKDSDGIHLLLPVRFN